MGTRDDKPLDFVVDIYIRDFHKSECFQHFWCFRYWVGTGYVFLLKTNIEVVPP